MKKLFLLVAIASMSFMTTEKAKAWCVLCLKEQGALEQMMMEDNHHIRIDESPIPDVLP